MSTGYTLVNSKKKDDAQKLAKVLSDIQEHCRLELNKAEKEAPLMSDIIEDIRLQLRRALQNCSPWYREDEYSIGTNHGSGFDWAIHNCFRGVEDVRAFLDGHPDYHIEDEYGSEVSLENFAALVSGNACAISLPREVSGK